MGEKKILNSVCLHSWVHNGRAGPVDYVVTTMVTKVMIF